MNVYTSKLNKMKTGNPGTHLSILFSFQQIQNGLDGSSWRTSRNGLRFRTSLGKIPIKVWRKLLFRRRESLRGAYAIGGQKSAFIQ